MAAFYNSTINRLSKIDLLLDNLKVFLDTISDLTNKDIQDLIQMIADRDCFPTDGATIALSQAHINLSKGKLLEKARLVMNHFKKYSASFLCSLCEPNNGKNFIFDSITEENRIVVNIDYCKNLLNEDIYLQSLMFFKELKYINSFYKSIGCIKKKNWEIKNVLNHDKYDLLKIRIPNCNKDDNYLFRLDCHWICKEFPSINLNTFYGLMAPMNDVLLYLQRLKSSQLHDLENIKTENDDDFAFKRYLDVIDDKKGMGEYSWILSNESGWDLSSQLLAQFISNNALLLMIHSILIVTISCLIN
jgi:hypothetical protein